MATYTPNLNLKKPAGTDYVRIADFNENADTIDATIGNKGQLQTADKTSLVGAINEAAKSGGENAPFIDEDTKHWMVWSAELLQYVDTGIKAEAKSGVYIGGAPPTDPDINVWICPTGGFDIMPTMTESEYDSIPPEDIDNDVLYVVVPDEV